MRNPRLLRRSPNRALSKLPYGHVWLAHFRRATPVNFGECIRGSVLDIQRNKAVVQEFDDLGNRGGDLDRLDSICTPGMVNHALAPHMPAGLEGTRAFLRSARRDVHGAGWLNSVVVAEEDMVVQFGRRELHWPGGSFLGFNAHAGTAVRDVMFAYRLVDGRIAERWAIRDDLSMLIQLGALRPDSA